MGLFDKFGFKNNKKEVEKKDIQEEVVNYPEEFEYNPLEDKVAINIVQNEKDGELRTFIVMSVYDKGEEVYVKDEKTKEGKRLNTTAKAKNEVILKEIKTAKGEPITVRDEQILILERLYKRTSIGISDAIDNEERSVEQKAKTIAEYLSELDYTQIGNQPNSYIMQNTKDGEKFDVLTASKEYNPNIPKHYFESSIEDKEKVGRSIKPISFKKSLYREKNLKILNYPVPYKEQLQSQREEEVDLNGLGDISIDNNKSIDNRNHNSIEGDIEIN